MYLTLLCLESDTVSVEVGTSILPKQPCRWKYVSVRWVAIHKNSLQYWWQIQIYISLCISWNERFCLICYPEKRAYSNAKSLRLLRCHVKPRHVHYNKEPKITKLYEMYWRGGGASLIRDVTPFLYLICSIENFVLTDPAEWRYRRFTVGTMWVHLSLIYTTPYYDYPIRSSSW